MLAIGLLIVAFGLALAGVALHRRPTWAGLLIVAGLVVGGIAFSDRASAAEPNAVMGPPVTDCGPYIAMHDRMREFFAGDYKFVAGGISEDGVQLTFFHGNDKWATLLRYYAVNETGLVVDKACLMQGRVSSV